MKQDTLRISEMTSAEIVEVAQICSAMFTPTNLTDTSASAYVHILKNNFSGMKGQEIINLCAKAAANPPKADFKFSPSFLSVILRGYEKINQTMNHQEHVATQAERYKHRQKFLQDLYADFDDYQKGMKPKRIKVWQYVAEQLVRNRVADRMPVITEQRQMALKDMLSQHEPFVLDCFKKLIQNKQHVSQIIYGLEN